MSSRFTAFLLAALLVLPAAQAQTRPPRPRAATPTTPPAAPATPRPAAPPMMNPSSALLGQMMLPTPNQYRNADGRPGPAYWQQKADYRIRASLDPNQHKVTGTVMVHYTNNAPEPLQYLWMALEQNLFAPGSRGANIQPADSRWRGSFPGGGDILSKVEVSQNGQRYGVTPMVDDTRMRLDLRQPVPAGGSVDVEVDYSFIVPEYGADRLARFSAAKGTVYEVAQWYPRMYVYDDVNGWNPLPYYGQGEFYLSYGDYDVEITAPSDLVVVGSGELQNPQEVYTAEQVRRWAQARTSSATVPIIARDEVGTLASRPHPNGGMLTWKFRLQNARDFAWAASRAFIIDAASWDGTLLVSAYPEEGIGTPGQNTEGWEMSTQFLKHTIQYYSTQWFRYPYPVATNVAGTVGGMEYPGIVFCGVRARGQGLNGVTDHEFGHTWFPMIVGSDERRYAWMDEGFNTFINRYSALDYYRTDAQRAQRTGADGIARGMTAEVADQPIMTYPDVIRANGLGFLAYSKPGAGLVLLREYLLGPERFDTAFREYIRRWAFKHPQPADFFRTMEDVSGEDLDYFWRGWFYTTSTFDQAITGIENAEAGSGVTVENRGGLVMPTLVEVTYEDGTTDRRRIPALAYSTKSSFTVPFAHRVRSAKLDPDGWLPDTDRANDTWPATPASTRPAGGQ